MADDGHGEGAAEHLEVAAQSLCRLSAALPPFSQLGSETTAMLMPLVQGEAPAQAVELTAAIAVQVWLVFCGPEASAELAQVGRAGVYAVLCALALGKASPQPSSAELDRFYKVLERKPPRPGLVPQFREALKGRGVRGLPRDAAMRRLLLRWQQQPFKFEFGSSGGGGSADPGGGGSGMWQAVGRGAG